MFLEIILIPCSLNLLADISKVLLWRQPSNISSMCLCSLVSERYEWLNYSALTCEFRCFTCIISGYSDSLLRYRFRCKIPGLKCWKETGRKLLDIELSNGFLKATLNAQVTKKKNKILESFKITNAYSWYYTLKKWKYYQNLGAYIKWSFSNIDVQLLYDE